MTAWLAIAWAQSFEDEALAPPASDAATYFGICVGTGGDLDADGIPDLAVGTAADWVAVELSGGDSLVVTDVSQTDKFGRALEFADFDGDGHTELFVGATGTTSTRGAVHGYVYDGDMSQLLTLDGFGGSDFFGHVLGASDVDGDGLDRNLST